MPDIAVPSLTPSSTTTSIRGPLYVEHPIGTGFSFGHPYPETEEEASSDLDAFFAEFLQSLLTPASP